MKRSRPRRRLRLEELEPGTPFLYGGLGLAVKLGWFTLHKHPPGLYPPYYKRCGVRRADGSEGWIAGFVKVWVVQ